MRKKTPGKGNARRNNNQQPAKEHGDGSSRLAAIGHGDTAPHAENPDPQMPPLSRLEKAEKWAVIIGTVLALFGLGFVYWSITNDTKSSQNEQRAWMTVEDFVYDNLAVEGGSPHFFAPIVNTGNTPALRVTVTTRGMLTPKPFFDVQSQMPPFGAGTEFKSVGIIGPGNKWAVNFTRSQANSKGDVAAMVSGASRLYFFGRVQYEDIFGRSHYTCFCYVAPPPGTDLLICGFWNETDETDQQDRCKP